MQQPSPLRIATYNIHKGIKGIWPMQRLEIYNIGQCINQFDADIICLQEVSKEQRNFSDFLPDEQALSQADFLAPKGYQAVYQTNAITKHGEHGNALLTRWPVIDFQQKDISDHRFEQRGLLHVRMNIRGHIVHAIVVHFGLFPQSRLRQMQWLLKFVRKNIPANEVLIIAGDFNGWRENLFGILTNFGLNGINENADQRILTFPSKMPLLRLDHIFTRGLLFQSANVPKGKLWHQVSDHLPLVVDYLFTPQKS